MRRLLKWIALFVGGLVLLLLLATAAGIGAIRFNARDGEPPPTGQATQTRRPDAPVSQVLFGDLHVHTGFSADAHVQGVMIRDGESQRGPADACDFARFCSGLDFWSINDHAESLTPALWQETVAAVRQCNEIAGDPADPDMVSFLGWEWSHGALTASEHYGHKNVVLLGTEDDRIPARPIASAPGPPTIFGAMGIANAFIDPGNFGIWANFHRYYLGTRAVDDCPDGVAVRDLPADCRESAPTPRELYDKLADWAHPALVIPHGLSWGITNPADADLAWQIRQHDPQWERLVEVYSGHGNSEQYASFTRGTPRDDGEFDCPRESPGVELCCQRARTLSLERCSLGDAAQCDAEAEEASLRAMTADRSIFKPTGAVAETTIEDWGDCSQLRDSFSPSFDYRPRQSAQYALALGSARSESGDSLESTDARFRLGFIAASDNHRGRPGTGYKEFARLIMSDGVSYFPPEFDFADARGPSFYYTGGLTAVHSAGRDRDAIFDALSRREVYGTSGPRILLWFDLLAEDSTHAMGSEVRTDSPPRFEVRAVGAPVQQPGCPTHVHDALPAERIASLCRSECYYPTDARHAITRIEVVRIRPQRGLDDVIGSRIEDPWKTLACDGGDTCQVSFEDPLFRQEGNEGQDEVVYYVRAIQEPTAAVNGDPLRCERDASGVCVRSRPCGFETDGTPEDCLADVEERAWSSPIFVRSL